MSQPTGHECARLRWPRLSASLKIALPSLLLLVTAQCTFPEYDNKDAPLGEAGTGAGASAVAGASASGGAAPNQQGGAESSVAGSSDPGLAGATGVAGEGGAPECPGEEWPVERCDGGCLIRYPDHCYDSERSGDELAPDCGGSCQPCVTEQCVAPADCLSGLCVPGPDGGTCDAPLVLVHDAHEKNNNVGSTAWSLSLQNSLTGGKAFTLRDLQLRYYFDRNGAAEPILVRATQANLRLDSGENRELKGTSWSVIRVEDVPEAAYNAYVEIAFADSGQLFPGDRIDLYEQMLTGDPSLSNFDQRANYSFVEAAGASERVSVHYRGKLIWGLEPRPANPRACFAKGINLNGPAVTVDGNAWLAFSQAGVSGNGTSISQGGVVYPPATGGRASALSTAYRLQAGHHFNVPVDNGEYLLFLYAVSPATDASSSSLTVDGVSYANSSKFRSQAADGGLAWARLGPYRTDVVTGQITVAVTTGAIDFAGFELWYPE